jgi:hypothetical protein
MSARSTQLDWVVLTGEFLLYQLLPSLQTKSTNAIVLCVTP